MNTLDISGALYVQMLKNGAASLYEYRSVVNDLNVFPIPDGDTGDNMYMTIDSGVSLFHDNVPESLETAADTAAKGMLFGARGNSGVILSRIFYGISEGFKGKQKASVSELSSAFENGVKEAYGAVAVPVEGTILTVYKDASAYASKRVSRSSTIESYFDDFSAEMQRSLERTPELLDVLKEAGVVDSGGAGFLYIVEGMRDALNGAAASETAAVVSEKAGVPDLSTFTEDSVLKFGYCTEFLLRLQRAKTDIEHFDIDAYIGYLNSVGDSVVCFRDGSILKVHVHTMKPGDVLNNAQRFGEFLTLKIENMTLQNNEANIENRFTAPVKGRKGKKKRYGIVAVAAGDGIKQTFSSLGCDEVVDGGQSMNPSAEDLLRAFEKINAETILVFPNNGNIILTAKQASELYGQAKVRIVPTRTIGEGYAAISVMDTDEKDADKLLTDLEEVIAGVVTGHISRAVRDAEKDGVKIRKDDYIGFSGDRVYVDAPDRAEAAALLSEELGANGCDIMLVICGASTYEEETKKLYQTLSQKYKRTEIIMIDGGQPVYDYILVLE